MNGNRERPIHRPLGDGLVLRTMVDDRDIERVVQLNTMIHGPEAGALAQALIRHYPGVTPRDVIFVENEQTGEAVSTLMLIPWTLVYAGVPLPAGEMGLVGTLEPYRRRGLVSAQVIFFKERLRERGCLLSHIQGIPYYYRQYGYEYAMPLEGGLRLSGRELPPAPVQDFTFLRATDEDIPLLAELFDAAASDLGIHAERTIDEWRYQFHHAQGTEMEGEVWLVKGDGAPAGYFRLPDHHFGDELAVSEVWRLSYDQALAVLHRVAAMATERNLPGVRLNLPATITIMRAARSFDAHDLGTYAWQVAVPYMAALLWAIGPALEGRIAASPFAGLTSRLQIGFFRDSVLLDFSGGRLTLVCAGGPAQGEIHLPPLAFIPLLLGYRTLSELHAAYPDVGVSHACRLLLDTLFPPMTSFLYPPY